MFICVPCVCSVNRGQKRASDPKEGLELEMVVRYHVGEGGVHFPHLLEKSSKAIDWQRLGKANL